jgi:hypothetical protein
MAVDLAPRVLRLEDATTIGPAAPGVRGAIAAFAARRETARALLIGADEHCLVIGDVERARRVRRTIESLGSARVPLNEMVEPDNLCVVRWSPWLDLKILLRTAAFVLARKGM